MSPTPRWWDLTGLKQMSTAATSSGWYGFPHASGDGHHIIVQLDFSLFFFFFISPLSCISGPLTVRRSGFPVELFENHRSQGVHCNFKGRPRPQITWYKHGSNLKSFNHTEVELQDNGMAEYGDGRSTSSREALSAIAMRFIDEYFSLFTAWTIFCPFFFFCHERTTITSETSENTIFVRFYFTLYYLMRTGKSSLKNFVPRVFGQFGQRVSTRRDSGIMDTIFPEKPQLGSSLSAHASNSNCNKLLSHYGGLK